MSMTFNMVGGGGGGLSATDAILRVQAPAGSTVTISKGAISKSDLGHENANDHTLYDYYFIIHQSQFDSANPWTVTATLSGDTASDTIIIDAADEYDLELSYALYLYKNGVIETAVSGGLVAQRSSTAGTNYSLTNENNELTATQTYSSSNPVQGVFYRTINKVDISSYSTLHIRVTTVSFSDTSSAINPRIGVTPSEPSGDSIANYPWAAVTSLNAGTTEIEYTVDISALSGDYYVGFALRTGNQTVKTATVVSTQFWLTR